MAKRDYYEVLGVSKDATDADIKSAYRKKAKECHPDLHPDDKAAEEKFKELNEANEVLSDPQKRAKYDQYGFDGPNMNGFGGSGFDGFSGFGDIGDIFSQVFGGGMGGQSRRNGPQQGRDLQKAVSITFEEAYFGCQKTIEFSRDDLCDTCHGSGAKPGTQVQNCPTCGGRGQVQTGGGFFVQVHTCPTCHGDGKVAKEKCSSCSGTGHVRRKHTIRVNVPAGIETGMILKQRGEGEPGLRGGPAGDFRMEITVKPHKLFQREGSNIYLELPISMTQAALGAEVEIPTMEGKDTLRIPEGTQNGAVFRKKGLGFPSLRNGVRGDLVITVNVEVPKGLSEKQKDLLRQFEASIGGREYSAQKSFSNVLKGIFGK